MKMNGIWKDMEINTNAKNMKGEWKEKTGNECKMKGMCLQMRGKWRNINANECKLKGTWSVAEAPEINKTTPWFISEPV